MTEHKSDEDRAAGLRRLAEKRSRESASQTTRTIAGPDDPEVFHELQVHQIELQNGQE